MIISLCACGNSADNLSAQSATETTVEAQTETTSQTETPTENATQAETETESKIESEYKQGVEAMDNGEWDIAIQCFSDIEYKDSEELLEICKKEKGMHENADYAFLEAIGESVMERYEVAEETNNTEKCIEIELEILGGFKDKTFYDNDLKKLAISYIDGVELEKQSLSEEDGHVQLKYHEGHAKRFEALKLLTDNYGLLNDNIDYKTTYYNQADKEIEYYYALKEVEADLQNQYGDNVNISYVNEVTSRIQIKNNTKYDYDMIMHFIFYDINGTIIDTNDYYYKDIKAGKNYNLDFYFPPDTESFDFYAEEYIDL